VLRLTGGTAQDRTARVIAQVPVAVATYLINEKSANAAYPRGQERSRTHRRTDENIQTPEYSIRRVRHDEMDLPEHRQATYLMPSARRSPSPGLPRTKKPQSEAPAVAPCCATAAPGGRRPRRSRGTRPGRRTTGTGWLLARLKRLLAGEPVAADRHTTSAAASPAPRRAAMAGHAARP